MNPVFYYSITIALYAFEIFLSIIISDISKVFGFIGAIATTSMTFFIPSLLFSMSYYKFASFEDKKKYRTLNKISIVNFIAGIGFTVFFFYADILSI